ncbi:MAG TPA: AAA family ATPase [Leptospiraceae bacterium]|nr:AAA family ATPase [Leptospiraceae bacterium]HRG75985.1 AAA family ATPase [Leptospiraceae bacterium]
MRRIALEYLNNWKTRPNRKPLILRGARQVGKSYLVRIFAEKEGLDLLELNLETEEGILECFQSKNPLEIISLLELKKNRKIIPGKTILFLDEIQKATEIFASLRYFYEKLPELHVILAGSLFDFVFEEHNFSMPVGRIEYLYLGPMTFKEFLEGLGKENLSQYLSAYCFRDKLPLAIHEELLKLFKIYLVIGGMPEAVQTYKDTNSFLEVDRVKKSILLTYRDDFSKYSSPGKKSILQKIFQTLPASVGKKIKYMNLAPDEKIQDIKKALHLLSMARIYTPVFHTAGNGIPLRAQINEKIQKCLMLDVGLLNSAYGYSYADFISLENDALFNIGNICEQFVGQHLLYSGETFEEPELFYWVREKSQSSAELDYIISVGPKIIPIEVKAGKTGTLKSLQSFMKEKEISFGVRFNANLPILQKADFSLPNTKGEFQLLSLPVYMVEDVIRHIKEI